MAEVQPGLVVRRQVLLETAHHVGIASTVRTALGVVQQQPQFEAGVGDGEVYPATPCLNEGGVEVTLVNVNHAPHLVEDARMSAFARRGGSHQRIGRSAVLPDFDRHATGTKLPPEAVEIVRLSANCSTVDENGPPALGRQPAATAVVTPRHRGSWPPGSHPGTGGRRPAE